MHDAPEVSCAEAHVAVPPATLSRPSANHTPPEGWRRLRARRAPTLRRAGTRDVGGNVLRVASPTGWYFRLPILMASDESMRSGREGSGSTGDVGASCERLDRVCQDAPGGNARTHASDMSASCRDHDWNAITHLSAYQPWRDGRECLEPFPARLPDSISTVQDSSDADSALGGGLGLRVSCRRA